MEVLAGGASFKPREIAARVNLTPDTICNELLSLLKTGSVVRFGKPSHYRYQSAAYPLEQKEFNFEQSSV